MTERIVLSKFRGLTVEEQNSFAGGDPESSATDLFAESIEVELDPGMIPREYTRPQNFVGAVAQIHGGKGGTLKFRLPLRGGGGAEAENTKLLKRIGCKLISVNTCTGQIDLGTSDSFSMTDAEATAAGFEVGCGVIHIPGSGSSSIRFVKRIQTGVDQSGGGGSASDTVVTVNQDFAVAPSNGDTIYASDTIVPDADSVPDKYFAFNAYYGNGETDNKIRIQMEGCTGTFTIPRVQAREIPFVEYEFQIDDWTVTEESTTLGSDSYDPAVPILGDVFLVDGDGVNIRGIEFNPGFNVQALMATGGANGRQGFVFSDMQATYKVDPLHDTDWITKLEEETEFDGQFYSIGSYSRCWSLWVPATQVVSYAFDDDDGVVRAGMDFQVNNPGVNDDDDQLPPWAIMLSH